MPQIGPEPIDAQLVVAAQHQLALVEDLVPAPPVKASSRLVSRPWLATRPAVALPLLYSSRSGASAELRIMLPDLLQLVERLLLEIDRHVRMVGLELLERLGPGDALARCRRLRTTRC